MEKKLTYRKFYIEPGKFAESWHQTQRAGRDDWSL